MVGCIIKRFTLENGNTLAFFGNNKKTSKVWLKNHISVFDFFSFFFEKWIGPTTIWNSFEKNWNNMVWVCELVCTTHVHNKCRQCGYRLSGFFSPTKPFIFLWFAKSTQAEEKKTERIFFFNKLSEDWVLLFCRCRCRRCQPSSYFLSLGR